MISYWIHCVYKKTNLMKRHFTEFHYNSMDRYVRREPRLGNPQPNQIIAMPSTSRDGNNMTLAENPYYGTFEPVLPNAQRINNPGIIVQNPGQIQSGIDPQYLATYPGSSNYVAGQQQNQGFLIPMQRDIQEQQCIQQQAFQGQQRYQAPNYQNIIPETSDAVIYTNYMNKNVVGAIKPVKKYSNELLLTPKGKSQTQLYQSKQSKSSGASTSTITEESSSENVVMPLKEITTKPIETIVAKNEAQNLRKMRSDKLQALYKSGPRAFSGPVEKVLKWHKLLKEIGVLVLYEIVAKCLRVRQGKPCEKILVIKDEIGPAMEVVYYEIDFLLPEFTIPCTVRVVGRMLSGSCRLQAYSVRAATGDDIASLPRRAAVAQHHVAKLAKEYTQ